MDDGASRGPAPATKVGSASHIDGPASGRGNRDINYPLQAGVPPNTPDRRILAACGPQRYTFIENSKY
jgi:hypothetical protein